jgi:magnesium transporter
MKDNHADIYDEHPLEQLLREWDAADEETRVAIFASLASEKRIALIKALPSSDHEPIIAALDDQGIARLLADMEPDDLVDIMQNTSAEVRHSVWNNLNEDMRKETLYLLRFDEDDAAGIMTPRYLALQSGATVDMALRFIRSSAESVETIYYIYVVDGLQRLKGVLSLKTLLTTPDTVRVGEIMEREIISVDESTDQEEVARTLETHDFLALPVVDSNGRLLGIVTFDDVIDVIREEHTEDMYKMGAMDGVVEPYFNITILGLVKKRIPWLIILLILGTVTTNVLHHYESIIIGAAFLFIFMPVITQTGGNSGGQSSTLMIRGLATGEIHTRDFWSVMARELVVGAILGLATGIVIIARSILLPPGVEFLQAVAIGASLVVVVLFSNIVGALAPIAIYRLGYDPTVMSAPLMATLIDVCGITIYFEMAKLILGY